MIIGNAISPLIPIISSAGLPYDAPLDDFSSSIGSWSTARKLRTAYAGNCMKVRRDSDNDTLDIGFTATGALNIDALATFVGVGSGFDQEQRRLYFKNPELIIGKTITVQYFEETLNQDGCHSLRFPVIKYIYENGRLV